MTAKAASAFPLSPQQNLTWERQRGAPRPFHAAALVKVGGPLDDARFRAVCVRLVRRHGILRTTFRRREGLTELTQGIAEDLPAELLTVDMTAIPPAAQQAGVEAVVRRRCRESFDFERGPLFRLTLVRLERGSHLLSLVLSGLCGDLTTIDRLVTELATCYTSGEAAPTEDGAAVQYADVSEVFNEIATAPDLEAGRVFWRDQDLAARLAIRLPLEGPGTADGRRLEIPVAAGDAAARLEPLAASLGTSAASLLLTAWSALLQRLTGRAETTVGVHHEGRSYEGLEDAVGPFARRLPLAAKFAASADFITAVAALDAELAEVAEWQDCLGASELAAAGVEPAELSWPFGFARRRPAPEPAGAEVRFEVRRRAALLDVCDLEFVADGPRLTLYCDAARHAVSACGRLANWLATLLSGLVAEPRLPIERQALLSAAEAAQLEALNATAEPYPLERPVDRWFEEQAARCSHRVAVVFGGERWSFAELDRRARRIAAILAAEGAGPEVLTAILARRSNHLVAAILGVLKAGGAYMPLDPAYPPERLRFQLADSGARILLVEAALDGLVPASGVRRMVLESAPGPEGEAVPRAPRRAAPENLAYVLYTSGSTGVPKGVMVHHRALANYLHWCVSAYRPSEGGAAVHSPVGFDLTVTSLYAPLLAGHTITLVPEDRGVSALVRTLLEGMSYSLLKLTPAHLELLGQILSPAEARAAARTLIVGGEALYGDRLDLWRRHAPATRVVNEYGPTEATVGCSVFMASAAEVPDGPVPIGRPIANTRLYLFDRALNPVPEGLAGEIFIGGTGLARGYLGRPGLTAGRFLPAPRSAPRGARLYRTGDLGRRRADGSLEFLGRNDDQLKIRGFRIEPGEIEAALEALPPVREAVVIGRVDGSGALRLVAYAVPAEPDTELGGELADQLAHRLPKHLVPDLFVSLKALPLTVNGKVDRAALPEPDWSRAGGASYQAPRTETEELLAVIWAQVLGLERLGIDDNYFNLGGDSIRAVRMVALARQRGLELDLRTLFKYRTLHDLAPVVRRAGGDPVDSTALAPFDLVTARDRARLPDDVVDAYPLVRLQAGMLFHSQIAAGSAIYHDQHSWHLRARLDIDFLRLAIDQLVGLHPVLRTSFDLGGFSEPLQLVYRRVDTPLEVIDLTAESPATHEETIARWMSTVREQVFDWNRAPLLCFTVHRRDADRFQFTLRFHHAVLDGWSAASLVTSLFRRYFSLLDDEHTPVEREPRVGFRELRSARERRPGKRRHPALLAGAVGRCRPGVVTVLGRLQSGRQGGPGAAPADLRRAVTAPLRAGPRPGAADQERAPGRSPGGDAVPQRTLGRADRHRLQRPSGGRGWRPDPGPLPQHPAAAPGARRRQFQPAGARDLRSRALDAAAPALPAGGPAARPRRRIALRYGLQLHALPRL